MWLITTTSRIRLLLSGTVLMDNMIHLVGPVGSQTPSQTSRRINNKNGSFYTIILCLWKMIKPFFSVPGDTATTKYVNKCTIFKMKISQRQIWCKSGFRGKQSVAWAYWWRSLVAQTINLLNCCINSDTVTKPGAATPLPQKPEIFSLYIYITPWAGGEGTRHLRHGNSIFPLPYREGNTTPATSPRGDRFHLPGDVQLYCTLFLW